MKCSFKNIRIYALLVTIIMIINGEGSAVDEGDQLKKDRRKSVGRTVNALINLHTAPLDSDADLISKKEKKKMRFSGGDYRNRIEGQLQPKSVVTRDKVSLTNFPWGTSRRKEEVPLIRQQNFRPANNDLNGRRSPTQLLSKARYSKRREAGYMSTQPSSYCDNRRDLLIRSKLSRIRNADNGYGMTKDMCEPWATNNLTPGTYVVRIEPESDDDCEAEDGSCTTEPNPSNSWKCYYIFERKPFKVKFLNYDPAIIERYGAVATSPATEDPEKAFSPFVCMPPDCREVMYCRYFHCRELGFFPDTRNCSKYFFCDLNKNGFVLYHMLCPPGRIFDPALRECRLKDIMGERELQQYQEETDRIKNREQIRFKKNDKDDLIKYKDEVNSTEQYPKSRNVIKYKGKEGWKRKRFYRKPGLEMEARKNTTMEKIEENRAHPEQAAKELTEDPLKELTLVSSESSIKPYLHDIGVDVPESSTIPKFQKKWITTNEPLPYCITIPTYFVFLPTTLPTCPPTTTTTTEKFSIPSPTEPPTTKRSTPKCQTSTLCPASSTTKCPGSSTTHATSKHPKTTTASSATTSNSTTTSNHKTTCCPLGFLPWKNRTDVPYKLHKYDFGYLESDSYQDDMQDYDYDNYYDGDYALEKPHPPDYDWLRRGLTDYLDRLEVGKGNITEKVSESINLNSESDLSTPAIENDQTSAHQELPEKDHSAVLDQQTDIPFNDSDRGKRSRWKNMASTNSVPKLVESQTLPDFEKSYNEDSSNNLDGYPCREYARYPDKYDDWCYYECGFHPDGSMKIEHKCCLKGEIFSPEYLECIATEYLKMTHPKRSAPNKSKSDKKPNPDLDDNYEDDKEATNEWLDDSRGRKDSGENSNGDKNNLRIFHLQCRRNSTGEKLDTRIGEDPPHFRKQKIRSFAIRKSKNRLASESRGSNEEEEEEYDDEEEYEDKPEDGGSRKSTVEAKRTTEKTSVAETSSEREDTVEASTSKVLIDADIRVGREFENTLRNILREKNRKRNSKDSILIRLTGDNSQRRTKRNFFKKLFSKKNKIDADYPDKEGVVSIMTLINGLPSEYDRDVLMQKLQKRKMLNTQMYKPRQRKRKRQKIFNDNEMSRDLQQY